MGSSAISRAGLTGFEKIVFPLVNPRERSWRREAIKVSLCAALAISMLLSLGLATLMLIPCLEALQRLRARIKPHNRFSVPSVLTNLPPSVLGTPASVYSNPHEPSPLYLAETERRPETMRDFSKFITTELGKLEDLRPKIDGFQEAGCEQQEQFQTACDRFLRQLDQRNLKDLSHNFPHEYQLTMSKVYERLIVRDPVTPNIQLPYYTPETIFC